MPSTEQQIKDIIAESNGRADKQQILKALRITSGYCNFVLESLKKKGEVLGQGKWYVLAEVKNQKIHAVRGDKRKITGFALRVVPIVKLLRGTGIKLSKGAQLINKAKQCIVKANRKGVRTVIIGSIVIFPLIVGVVWANGIDVFTSGKGDFFTDSLIKTNSPLYEEEESIAVSLSQPQIVFSKLPVSEERKMVPKTVMKLNVVVTFYSSTYEETDVSPFITANGSNVRDSIAAANFLAFGTRIKIPELFGDKMFTIEDRMHPRFSDRVDIWVPTRYEALYKGVRYTAVEIY